LESGRLGFDFPTACFLKSAPACFLKFGEVMLQADCKERGFRPVSSKNQKTGCYRVARGKNQKKNHKTRKNRRAQSVGL